MEQQQQSEAELAREKVEELESALDDEKRKRDACEQQIQQHLQVWTKLSFENEKYFYSKINFFHLLALNSMTLKYDKIMIQMRALLFPTLHDSTGLITKIALICGILS